MKKSPSTPRTRNRDGQPWLQQLDSGIWRICHSPGDGTTTRLSTKTKDEGQAKEALERYRLSLKGETSKALLTVGAVFDYYSEQHVSAKANDVERRDLALGWLRASLGDMTIAALQRNPLAIQQYMQARRAATAPVYVGRATTNPVRKAGEGTLRYEMNALVTAFNYAAKHQRIPANALPHFDMPDAPEPNDIWLTETEHDWLLEFVRWEDEEGRMSRIWRFVALALGTAARKSAIIQLPWEDVDLAAGRVYYRQGVQRSGAQRSSKRTVTVPIADWLLPLLQRAYEERKGEYVLDDATEPSGAFETLCRRAFKATGNPKFRDLTPHVMRHTTATLMARAGVPIVNIAGVLGNSVAVCQRNYLHHTPDHLVNAVNFRTPISTITEQLL
ncbi:tyrosine-type recombinase/integrase [Pseudomonas sp. BF-R-21]|uniref:tyrosine-type recombinase/integrase n=1 Tax=Pseudomonas sp. BF-R-21 TaxID=2832387 RepID=UPI001CBB2184|nr:site-specific integrase [Pseudomonas sp. BF-R-21]